MPDIPSLHRYTAVYIPLSLAYTTSAPCSPYQCGMRKTRMISLYMINDKLTPSLKHPNFRGIDLRNSFPRRRSKRAGHLSSHGSVWRPSYPLSLPTHLPYTLGSRGIDPKESTLSMWNDENLNDELLRKHPPFLLGP